MANPGITAPTTAGQSGSWQYGAGGATFVPTVAAAAPASSTSTKAPAATPTAVVSSANATDHINTQIVPAMTQGAADIAGQKAKIDNANVDNPYYMRDGETPAAYTARVAAYNASKAPTPPPPPTPEDTIANTPDSGNQWYYDRQGNRIQAPVGQTPNGYFTANPTVAPTTPVIGTTTDNVGNTYQQYSDGTYGKLDATGKYVGPITSQEFQSNKTGQDILTSLNQVVNGTYPLNPSQQAQVDGLKASFTQLINDQITANANYTGGVTVAENLYGMGNNLVGLGAIKTSIDAGVQKIAEINSKMGSAVAQMMSAFQNDNFKMLSSAYQIYSEGSKARQDEIDKLNKVADDAIQQQKDDAYKAARDKVTDALDNEKLSWTEKQDVISNTLAQAKLDEDKRHNLATEAATGIGNQTNNLIGNLPPAQFGANGAIDPKSQADFLATLPGGPTGDLATLVKGVANYNINPNVSPQKLYKGTAGLTQEQLVTLASKYDPTYSQAQFSTRQALVKNFTSGLYSQNITSLNTAASHIGKLIDTMSTLGNVNAFGGVVNPVKNTLGPLFTGSGAVAAAQTHISAVTTELATALRKSGVTDTDIKNLGVLDPNSTPDQVNKYIETATSLLGARLQNLSDTYAQGMGKMPTNGTFLNDAAAESLLKLQQAGLKVDVPGLDQTPVAKVAAFGDANPSQQAAIAKMEADHVPYQDILAAFNQS